MGYPPNHMKQVAQGLDGAPHTAQSQLLPYLEEMAVYEGIDFTQ